MESKIIVRDARLEDRKDIWEWWNDPSIRKKMKKNHYVKWDEHCLWFEEILKGRDKILCVGLLGSQKIGNARFTRRDDKIYDTSINLNPLFCGKGYGWRLLKESVNYLRKIRDPKKIFATITKTNTPSVKTFRRAGFVFKDPEYHYPGMEEFPNEYEYYCELNFITKCEMKDIVAIREANTEDRIALWQWRKDSISFKTMKENKPFKWDEHCLWFDRLLKEKNRILYIGLADTLRIGCVRFDQRARGEYEVSVYLKPTYCGRGYGIRMLKVGIEHLVKVREPKKIIANVKIMNPASKRIFEEAGFSVMRENESTLRCELNREAKVGVNK